MPTGNTAGLFLLVAFDTSVFTLTAFKTILSAIEAQKLKMRHGVSYYLLRDGKSSISFAPLCNFALLLIQELYTMCNPNNCVFISILSFLIWSQSTIIGKCC